MEKPESVFGSATLKCLSVREDCHRRLEAEEVLLERVLSCAALPVWKRFVLWLSTGQLWLHLSDRIAEMPRRSQQRYVGESLCRHCPGGMSSLMPRRDLLERLCMRDFAREDSQEIFCTIRRALLGELSVKSFH